MIMRKARTSLAVVAVFFAIGTANAQSQNVPDNASVRGNNWFCNSGYQRNGNECVVLSEEEQALVKLQRQALILQNAGRSREIDGQSFSIRDTERRCEAYKYSNTYGDIECRGSELRIVERQCEAYFSDGRNGEMECSRKLRSISGRCSIKMNSSSYGDLSC